MWYVFERRRTGTTVVTIYKAEFETLLEAVKYRELYHRMHGVWLCIVDELGLENL